MKERDVPIRSSGSKIATVAGIIAVIAFFVLPYLNLGLFGTATGAQAANLLSNLASLASQFGAAFGHSRSLGFDPALALWGEVVFAALAASIAGWQWYKSSRQYVSVSKPATAFVLIFGLLSLALLLYQFVGLQGSAAGRTLASALGFGYWVMVLAAFAVVGGAIAQLRAS